MPTPNSPADPQSRPVVTSPGAHPVLLIASEYGGACMALAGSKYGTPEYEENYAKVDRLWELMAARLAPTTGEATTDSVMGLVDRCVPQGPRNIAIRREVERLAYGGAGGATDLHAQIMNLPCDPPLGELTQGYGLISSYKLGHTRARHAAAELVAAAGQEVAAPSDERALFEKWHKPFMESPRDHDWANGGYCDPNTQGEFDAWQARAALAGAAVTERTEWEDGNGNWHPGPGPAGGAQAIRQVPAAVAPVVVHHDFEDWWECHGQFSRAGGGEYEKTFAFNAWQARAALEGSALSAANTVLQEAVDALLDADKVAALNGGGGSFTRHVVPAILELRKVRAKQRSALPGAAPADPSVKISSWDAAFLKGYLFNDRNKDDDCRGVYARLDAARKAAVTPPGAGVPDGTPDYPPLPEEFATGRLGPVWGAVISWHESAGGDGAMEQADVLDAIIVKTLHAYVDADRAARGKGVAVPSDTEIFARVEKFGMSSSRPLGQQWDMVYNLVREFAAPAPAVLPSTHVLVPRDYLQRLTTAVSISHFHALLEEAKAMLSAVMGGEANKGDTK